ncbi:hypothetical protein [Mongoliimonas terrestris]|uniref:hypothetical protein n=1 Tax=Mongoliimonas terrestris TaxID=1709001 RepID=UPI000949AC13|nr:hypothetical protein [Mongoliimonas terrestris]
MTLSPPSFQTLLATLTPPRIAPIGVRSGSAAAPSPGGAPTLAPHTWNALVGEARVRRAGESRRAGPDRMVPAARTAGVSGAAVPGVSVTPTFRTGLEAVAVAFACHVQPLVAMMGRVRWAEAVLDDDGTGMAVAGTRRQTAEGLLAIDRAFAAAAIEEIARLFLVEGALVERDASGRSRLGAFALVYRGALFDARLEHRDGVLSAQVVDAASGFARTIDPAETADAWFGRRGRAGEER